MNQILEWLSTGDLRSDCLADQVVDFVLDNPAAFIDLYDGLSTADDVVRGHAADALEKIARRKPELYSDRLQEIITRLKDDPLPMVRWHLAMMLGHLAFYEEQVDEISKALLESLKDESVFVKSWVIVSLCIVGRLYPLRREEITAAITPLHIDTGIAIRSKVRKAMNILMDQNTPFPGGWVKSEQILQLMNR